MRLDPLLKNYPVRIREVTVGVILSISFLFYLFPRFLGEAEKITTTSVSYTHLTLPTNREV